MLKRTILIGTIFATAAFGQGSVFYLEQHAATSLPHAGGPDGVPQVTWSGPYSLGLDATGVVSHPLRGGARREILAWSGQRIDWIDLDSGKRGRLRPNPPRPVRALASLDFTGTPRPDLVMAQGRKLYVLDHDAPRRRWQGPITVPFEVLSLAAVDVVGNPRQDLAASDGEAVHVWNPAQPGDGFQPLTPAPPRPARWVEAVDVDAPPNRHRYLAAGPAARPFLYLRPRDGEPASWIGPLERRFRVRAATPSDLVPARPAPQRPASVLLVSPLEATEMRFVERSAAARLDRSFDPVGDSHGPGAVFTDLDRDSHPDIYLVGGLPQRARDQPSDGRNLFFWGRGSRFAKVSDNGTADRRNGAGALAFDYDNDGDRDLYVINHDGRNTLLEQRNRRFVDRTAATDPSPADPPGDLQEGLAFTRSTVGCEAGEPPPCRLDDSLAAAAGDFDRDGRLDVYVANHLCCGGAEGERDLLYMNRGPGEGGAFTFEEVGIEAGIAEDNPFGGQRSSQTVIVADFNNDLWPDIYVANKQDGIQRDFLFLNDGDPDDDGWDGTFSEYFAGARDARLGDVTESAMGIAAGDFDNDGDLDVFLSDIDEMDFYRNRLSEDGVFSLELVEPNALASPPFGWGTSWADFDNDGDLDLHLATQQGFMDYLQRNDGTEDGVPRFTDVTLAAGLGQAWNTRAALVADYDRDGRLDLLTVQRDRQGVSLFRNVTPPVHGWLRIELEGEPRLPGRRRSSRDAVGARVELDAGGVTQRRDVIAGGSTCASTADYALHFGLGRATAADEIRVFWPSGRVTTRRAVGRDQVLRIRESAN